MAVDLTSLFEDPKLMFFGVKEDTALFVRMDRESYARSIFFDRRLQPVEKRFINVPVQQLLDHLGASGFDPPKLRFIHHFAHSGSTLLARALERPGNLVIREPAHLRQVGVSAGAAAGAALPGPQDAMLKLSLALLGKRFAEGSTIIIKGNVPISLVGEAIASADPGQPAVLLHFPLEDYCAAVLRTPNHRRWVESVCSEIRLDTDPMVGDLARLSVAEKAGALWFAMIRRFETLLTRYPAMRSLEANRFFDRPEEAIFAVSACLDAGLDREEARSVAAGPLFSTYSKNPGLPYDASVRIERREQAKADLEDELRSARRWVERRAEPHSLPEALSRPLLGGASPLL